MPISALRTTEPFRFAADGGGASGPALTITPGAPADVIAQARARDVVLPDAYYGENIGNARGLAFTVSGLSSLEQIAYIKQTLDDALASGQSFTAWRTSLLRGDVPIDLPEWRLETIFRTNLATVYASGKWQQFADNTDTHPFAMYSAINDSRTRPNHAAMSGTILPIDHPWWQTHTPPCGYNCRCTVIALTEREAQVMGITEQPPNVAADPGFGFAPLSDVFRGADDALALWQSGARVPWAAGAAQTIADGQLAARSDDPNTWQLVGTDAGEVSYVAPDGRQFEVAFYPDPDEVRNEVAALGIAAGMGFDAAEATLAQRTDPNGIETLGSAIGTDDTLTPFNTQAALLMPEQSGALAGVSALLGLTNVSADSWAGLAFSADLSRIVLRRAPDALTQLDDAGDAALAVLLDPTKDALGALVFSKALATEAGRRAALDALNQLDEEHIGDALLAANIPPVQLDDLTRILLARRAALIQAIKDFP